MLEKELQANIVSLARRFGWQVYHTYNSRRSQFGFPDLVLVRERVIFAELKSDKGKLTKDQAIWIDKLDSAGAEVYVWRPDDLDDAAQILFTRT